MEEYKRLMTDQEIESRLLDYGYMIQENFAQNRK